MHSGRGRGRRGRSRRCRAQRRRRRPGDDECDDYFNNIYSLAVFELMWPTSLWSIVQASFLMLLTLLIQAARKRVP